MGKRIMAAGLAVALLLLAACGGAKPSTADYTQVLSAARPAELNEIELFDIVSGSGDALHDQIFSEVNGFVETDMERYAISLGMLITQAYGVAIILPAEGRHDAVLAQVNNYVEMQKKAQENDLQDQYEIAKTAIVKTAESGEILLAMCEGATDVLAQMEEGLKAG